MSLCLCNLKWAEADSGIQKIRSLGIYETTTDGHEVGTSGRMHSG